MSFLIIIRTPSQVLAEVITLPQRLRTPTPGWNREHCSSHIEVSPELLAVRSYLFKSQELRFQTTKQHNTLAFKDH